MENLDKHYLALGLRHGATQEEIRSAFRQMVKLYHPDKDSSLDAQMKFHEARQAYAALSKPAEPNFIPKPPNAATWSQASGSSNSTAGAKKGTANSGGFNGPIRDHPYFKKFFSDFTGMKPEEPNVFANISLHDYFFRPRLILTVIGSIAVIFIGIFIAISISYMPFTDGASARLFRHTAVFVLVTWVIFWYVRFGYSSQDTAIGATLLLSIVYSCWIYFYALWPEFHQLARNPSPRYSRDVFLVPAWTWLIFMFIFGIAAASLEKGVGLRGVLQEFSRRRKE